MHPPEPPDRIELKRPEMDPTQIRVREQVTSAGF